MADFKKGDKVKWSWGNGEGSGTVESVHEEKKEIQSKGQTITRKGSKDDPAVVIKDGDSKVLKLASELNKA